MHNMYYIGLDVHKRRISYCVKDGSGEIHAEGTIPATRFLPVGSTIACFHTQPLRRRVAATKYATS
jgi:predicted NBD/HSP70 family sugar kinase